MGDRRVAYLVSRFPKATETFIANEIGALEQDGWDISLYPIVRESAPVANAHMSELASRARFRSPVSWVAAAAHLEWFRRGPRAYLSVWWLSLRLPGLRARFWLRSLWTTAWAVVVARDVANDQIPHVHAHWATFPAQAAMVVSRLAGCSYSFTAHAHDIYANDYGLAEKSRCASFVVTISDFNRDLLNERFGVQRIEVIRCGADLVTFDARRPPRATGGNAELRVVCTGSLEEKKGHRFLVEAIGLLSRRDVRTKCRIVGEGDLRRALEMQIEELGLEDRIVLCGALSPSGVAAELADADIFVLPSVVAANGMMEGIPVALMEAMASSIPVVATAISGVPELVVDGVTGLLVPPSDPEALANALELLGCNRELSDRLADAGHDRVLVDYDLQTNARRLARRFLTTIEESAKSVRETDHL